MCVIAMYAYAPTILMEKDESPLQPQFPGGMTHRAYKRGSTILKVMNIEILPADYSGSALIRPIPLASKDA